MKIELNTERVDKEVEELKNKLQTTKKSRDKLVDSANKYIEVLTPILNKRKIRVVKTQIYFNDSCNNSALVTLDFYEVYGKFDGIKAQKLQKEIRAAGIPCPCSNFNRSVEITLYEGVLFGQKDKGGQIK